MAFYGILIQGGVTMNEDVKTHKSKSKQVIKDNLVPSAKIKAGRKALAGIGAGVGTAIQMKRGKSFVDAAKTGGLAGTAIGDVVGSAVIPQGKLIAMHKKEFGTMPSTKDMGKLFVTNTVPTAASWGAIMSLKKPKKFYQNNVAGIAEGLAGKGKKFKDVISYANSPEAAKMNNSDFVKELRAKLKSSKSDNSQLAKTMIKAMVADKVIDNVADLPSKFVTPESLINNGKERRKMNKTAFDVVNESFEKIAEEEKLDTKKRFWKDRIIPSVGLSAAGVAGGYVGGSLGAFGGGYLATKAMQKNMENKGYGKATTGDTIKSMVLNPFTLGLGYTPQTIAKDKERKRQQQEQKTACEIVSELFSE